MKKLYCYLLPVILLMLISGMASGNKSTISVSGTISSNTTWTGIDTILVTGNVTISNGVTLTIHPGMKVVFEGHYYINVKGRLLAIGTESDTIVFTVNDTTGYHNHSHTGWRGIRLWNTDAANDSTKLVHCRLEYGKDVDTERGGAILITGFKKLLVDHCELRYNYASLKGGAIFIWNGGGGKYINSRFHHNSTGYDGGAFFSWDNFYMANCRFENNFAGSGGGAINVLQGIFTMINNVVVNNKASSSGGGLYIQNSYNSIVLNNTIADNNAHAGGGIYSLNQPPDYRNCIIYGNNATHGKQAYIDGGFYPCNFYYCDIEDGRYGISGNVGDYEDCLAEDPVFHGNGSFPYSMLPTSSCINAGDPATTTAQAGPVDIAGNTRIYNGYEDVIDMGAYEYQGDPSPRLVTVFPQDNSAILETGPILKLVFNTEVFSGPGVITIHKQDGSVFEQIPALEQSLVSIDSNMVLIDPANDFVSGDDFYILIDSVSFSHTNGRFYNGIYNTETWNFSIGAIYTFAGNGLSFDGNEDYVEIADNDSLDLTTNYTIEAWIKPESFGDLDGIVSKYQTSGAHGYYLRFLPDSPYNGLDFDGMQTSSGVMEEGKWYHVAGVNDNGVRKVFINGILQTLTGTPTTVEANNNPLRIGVDYGSRFFEGTIDEVRIWKRPLSAGDIRSFIHAPLDGSEPGLVSYLQFNEEQDPETYDFISGFIGELHHMDDGNRVKAHMPFGKGAVNSQTILATGVVNFTGTGLAGNYTAFSGSDTVFVSRIDTIPNDLPSTVDTVYDSQYWVIEKFGNGSFTANLSFTIAEDLTADDQNNPSNVRLYTRETYGTGDWNLAVPASSVNASTNTAVFDGISAYGQFILGRHQGTTPFLVSGLYPSDNGSMKYNDDLKITFNEDATGVSGKSVRIYNSDGSLFEQIVLPSPQITGEGSETISIDPSNEMILGLQYYVLIDNGAFQDPFGKDFAGFSNPDEWNFTILYDGHIKSNTTWMDTILVSGNVIVDNGVTLTIEPGSVIEFGGTYKLDINGRLLAIGTATDKILFTKTGSTKWDAIAFTNVNTANDSSRIIHCILEHSRGSITTAGQGGPVYVNGTDKLLISDCVFRYNGGYYLGSALDCFNTSFHLNNCRFYNNHGLSGAAISCGSGANITVTNTVFYENKADWGGGALYIDMADPLFLNTSFINNVALDSSFGGAFYHEEGNPVFRNTIMYGNTSDYGPNQVEIANNYGDHLDFYYCDIQGGKESFTGDGAGENYSGNYEHNMDADPLTTGSGDYPCQLTIPSPCYNAGDPSVTLGEVGMYDAAGNLRFQHNRIDIGAYELTITPDGFPGHALYFDGTNGYVNLGNNNDFKLEHEITVEVWIKPDSITHNTYILKKGSIGLLHWDVDYETASGHGLQINIPGLNTGWWEFQCNMIYGKWYHIAWTRASDGTLTAYINGQIVRKGHFPGTMEVNSDDLVLSAADGSQRYKGLIDELRISGVARTPEEIRRNMFLTLPDFSIDFIAYWQLNEGSGYEISDVTQRFLGTLYFMDQTNWKNSTIPFGPGNSQSHIVSASGNYDFPDASVSINFQSISETDTIVVSMLDITPNVLPGDVSMVMDSSYWIINDYGNGDFSCDISFEVAEVVTAEDEVFPQRLKLFTRSKTGHEDWTLLASASSVDAASHKITFDGISSFGQFIVARNIVPDDFPGHALEFNGADDHISLVNSGFMSIDTALTVELWLKPEMMETGFHTLAHQGDAWEIRMFTDPALVIIEFGINNNSVFADFTTQPADFFGKWNHISCVFAHTGSNNHVNIYLNGVSGQGDNSEPISIVSDTVVIGEDFKGIVDEFRMWRSSRSLTAVRENMHLILPGIHPDLISYLQFNEGSGTTLFDVASDAEAALVNMNPASCWTLSSVPAGPGASNTQDESSGQIVFAGTGLSLDYSFNGSASVTATRILMDPNINPDGIGKVMESQYWVVNRFGTGSFSTDITFELNEKLSNFDVSNPEYIKLFTRDSNSDEAWTEVQQAGSVDLSSNTVSFESISNFSQFIVGKDVRTPDRFPGTALVFDGLNDHVSGTGIDTNLTAITLEAWVYHNTLPAEVQRYITVSPEVAVIRFDGTQYGGYHSLHFYIKRPDGNIWSSRVDSILTTGEWIHVAGTYDGTYMKTYVNGELVKTLTQSKGMYPANGEYGFGSGQLDGKMDQVRTWRVARTAEEIRESMNVSLTGLEPGLMSCWQFNDGSGTVLKDIVSGNDGTLVNMGESNWIPSTIPFGGGKSDSKSEANGVVDFDGTGLSMLFNSQSGAEVTVSRIDTLPNHDPMADTAFKLQYWAVHRYGNGSFNADVTFGVSEDLTAEHEANPSLIKLYTRGSAADSSWGLLKEASSVDAATDEATFTGITDFSQFVVAVDHPGFRVNLKAFLEGSFNGTGMDPNLNPGYLPLAQPYDISPWNYQGSEAVTSIPSDQIIDWVLVELRDTTQAGLAGGITSIGMQAAFLLSDGSVVSAQGLFPLKFHTMLTDSLFAVVWHRNHLGIISNFGLLETGGTYRYDFSSGEHQALNGANAQKELATGIWGMVSGDGNRDFEINNGDKIDVWAEQAGSNGYLEGDFNLDSHVNNGDKNDMWVPNTGRGCHVPD